MEGEEENLKKEDGASKIFLAYQLKYDFFYVFPHLYLTGEF